MPKRLVTKWFEDLEAYYAEEVKELNMEPDLNEDHYDDHYDDVMLAQRINISSGEDAWS